MLFLLPSFACPGAVPLLWCTNVNETELHLTCWAVMLHFPMVSGISASWGGRPRAEDNCKHACDCQPAVVPFVFYMPVVCVQVFSFSANAMPDDISVMTMAGERTRSGPPDDVKQ